VVPVVDSPLPVLVVPTEPVLALEEALELLLPL
jgi:hypothetical protein